jgi:integrase
MGWLWGKVAYVEQQGAWCVRGTWQGKRIFFSSYNTPLGERVCETEAEARQLQQIISHEVANGTFDPRRYRKQKPFHVATYIGEWLQTVEPTIGYATAKAYRAAAKHISDGLGDVFVPDLNYERILRWVNELRKELQLKTIKNYHGVLVKMLHDAQRSGHIAQMPEVVQFRGGLSVPSRDPEWLTVEQQSAVLAEIQPADRFIIRFIMATGVRPSEARALQKRDLYFQTNPPYIAIRHTFAPVPGGEDLKECKQKRERRIPFYQEVADLLKEMPASLTPWAFVHPVTGRHYTKNINRDIWNPACSKALGRIVPLNNAGRHSFANQRLAAGEDIYLVSRRLGHSSVKVTESNYINSNTVI